MQRKNWMIFEGFGAVRVERFDCTWSSLVSRCCASGTKKESHEILLDFVAFLFPAESHVVAASR